jgi:hypothetical protein
MKISNQSLTILFYYIAQAGWFKRSHPELRPHTGRASLLRYVLFEPTIHKEGRDMAERERHAHGKPEAERYHAEYVPLPGGAEGASLVALQEAINENARHSWKLISVAQDPTSQGIFLVWDTTGFFSG